MPREKTVSVPNRLLATLPSKDYLKLLPFLEPITLAFGTVLYEPGAEMEFVYFPNDCLVSLLTAVNDRQSAEVGLVGSEGMVGAPVVFGFGVSSFSAIVQGAGTALRMKAPRLRREFKKYARLQESLFKFTHLLMIQIAKNRTIENKCFIEKI